MKNLLKFKARVFICTTILSISIVSTISAKKKIAIIDAGSSGSRLWVYEVDTTSMDIKTVFPSGFNDNSKGEALSRIDTDSVQQFLLSLTKKYNVPTGDTIPLYLLATAGMRMVSQGKADSIYQEINKTKGQKLHINGFRIDTAMTISGQYEGFYAWFAANKKAGRLSKNKNMLNNTDTLTLGILEIGGASMQIAYAMPECVKESKDYISHKRFYNIYSKSYLHYGVDRIFEKLDTALQPEGSLQLDTLKGLFENDMKFVGLSKPINIVFDQLCFCYPTISDYSSMMNNKRKDDRKENFHPATNAIYIDWVVKKLKLENKLHKPCVESDWTEGAALDIIIYGAMPQMFDYANQN